MARIVEPPVFGRQLYELLGRSKIALNGAVDMAGSSRGIMRCFEPMGCGALLVSDDGNYPASMSPGIAMQTYASPEVAVQTITKALENWPRPAEIAARGREELGRTYTKSRQWQDFMELLERI